MKLARRLDRRTALRQSRRSAVKEQIRRALKAERLEDRCLLAGDVFQSDYYNPDSPTDVDADGYTAPNDALTIINALNAHGSSELPQGVEGEEGPTVFLDVDNDGHLSPNDALTVINFLNSAEGAPPDANDVAQYTLVALRPGTINAPANRITSVQVNQEFDLVILTEDLRKDDNPNQPGNQPNPNRGIFSGYLDLNYIEQFSQFQVAEVQEVMAESGTLGAGTPTTFRLNVAAFGSFPGGQTGIISWDDSDPTGTANREAYRASVETQLNNLLGAGAVKVSLIGDGGFDVSVWFVGFFNQVIPEMTTTTVTGPDAFAFDANNPFVNGAAFATKGNINTPTGFVEAFRSRQVAPGTPRGRYQEDASALDAPNLVDELGFFTSSLTPLGVFPQELLRVRVKAVLPVGNDGTTLNEIVFTPYVGDITLIGTPAGDGIARPDHNTLVYADVDKDPPEDQFVPPDKIAFNTLLIDIITGPITAGAVTANTIEEIQDLQIDVLAGVIDNPGDPTVPRSNIELVGIGSASAGGSVTIDTKGTTTKVDDTVVFDADPNFAGTVTFSYTAQVVGNTDVNQQSTGTVTVNVAAINDAPTLNAIGPQSIGEDAPTTVNLAGIGPGGGADEAAQTLTITATSDNPGLIASPVTVNYAPGATTGSLTFTPAANATGSANITVTVKDNGGTTPAGSVDTTTRTFTVTVNAVNDPPQNLIGGVEISGANNTVIAPGATFTFTGATQLSVNDVDAGSANLTTILSLPAGQGTLDVGTAAGVNITGDNTNSVTLTGPQAGINTALTSVIYTPGAGFTATLTMASTDNANATTTSTITISRDPGVRPFAVDDSLSIAENTTAAQPIDVLNNDFKEDGAVTTVVAVTQPTPAQGSVAFTATGVTYTPPGGDFFGTVTFTYTIDDDDATTTATLDERTGTVVVTITPVNDAPIAVDDQYQAAIGSQLIVTANGTPKGVLFNDSDVDNDTLIAFNAVIAPGQGTVVLSPDGGFTYTPPSGGDFTFTYQVRDRAIGDASGLVDTATVSIHVVAPPTANPDDYTATEDVVFNSPISVLADDTDTEPGAPALTAELVAGSFTGPGTLDLNPTTGNFTWTPPANANFNTTRPPAAPVQFRYRASSGGRVSNEALVTIVVNEVNDPPTANDDEFLAVRQQSGIGIDQVVNVKVNDTDAPDGGGEVLTVTGVSATGAPGSFVAGPVNTPGGGSVKVVGGQVLYTSPTTIPLNGDDSFFYQLDDGRGGTSTDTARVAVEVVDFVPKTISGTVYVDSNGDGVQGAGEVGLSGVEVRLTGTAFDNSPVSFTSFTDINGNYIFPQVAGQPGVEDVNTFIKPPNATGYTITEITPFGLLNGIDSETHLLVENLNPFDGLMVARWNVTDASGDITGLFFGEAGVDFRAPGDGGVFLNTGGFKQEFLASSGHNGFVLALDGENDLLWSWTLDDPNILGAAWAGVTSISAELSSDLSILTLTCVDSLGTHTAELQQGYSIPGSTARFRVLATGVNGEVIIRIDGSYNGPGDGIFVAAAAQAAGGPEGEAPVDPQFAEAADALFSQREWA